MDARRADALVSWALAALADPDLPKRHGRPVELHVVTDLPTMLGLAENPAELLGYGTIPGSVARVRGGDANWRRLIIDPVTGHGSPARLRPPGVSPAAGIEELLDRARQGLPLPGLLDGSGTM